MGSIGMSMKGCVTSSTERPLDHPLCADCRVRKTSLCGALLGGNSYWWETQRKRVEPRHSNSAAREVLYYSGEQTQDVYVICEGWAVVYHRLNDGRRQIMHFLIPGDFAGAGTIFRDKMGHSLEALTDLRIGLYKRSDLRTRVLEESWAFDAWSEDNIGLYWQATQVALALGQLTGPERIAALVINLRDRLAARGLVSGESFAFPLRQTHIAEAIGLSLVHVSRVIGDLRKSGIVDIKGGRLTILDLPKLRKLAEVF